LIRITAAGVPKESADVLEEDGIGVDFTDDSGDVWPDPALVGSSLSSAGNAVRLAREASNDSLKASTPGSPIEL
jgi:hypothetical protein